MKEVDGGLAGAWNSSCDVPFDGIRSFRCNATTPPSGLSDMLIAWECCASKRHMCHVSSSRLLPASTEVPSD